MGRNSKTGRRTPLQAGADRASLELSKKLGRMLRDGRLRLRMKQQQAGDAAGISRGRWADLEGNRDALATLTTYGRAAAAVGGSLEAYIKETSAADQPRDAVHLRHQELIIRLGKAGEWRALPEEFIDRDARTSRAADVLLHRNSHVDGIDEYALWDVRDWLDDVGAVYRDFIRRLDALDRYAVARMPLDTTNPPRIGGVFVVRATARNRQLVRDHRHFFAARFPGSAGAWLRALQDPTAPMPTQPALVWVAVNGDRLFASRLG